MIIDERMRVYINSLSRPLSPMLEALERDASREGVPIIRPETQSLIRTVLAMKTPRSILEIGTAVGFSALLMREYAPEGAKITTIENYPKRIAEAERNFAAAGAQNSITLLCGDAGDILPGLTGKYDLIFMDAAKGQYIRWLPDILRLMAPGAVMLSDNVLQEGDLIESHYLVERRNRTIYRRMRDYLYELTHHPMLITSILPVGDGVALIIRQETEDEKA